MNSRTKLALLGLLLGTSGGIAGGAAAPQIPDPCVACCSAVTIQVSFSGADATTPAAGAWVRLTQLSELRPAPWQGRTDSRGMITFTQLPPGLYTAAAAHKDLSGTASFRLEPCSQAWISIALSPAN